MRDIKFRAWDNTYKYMNYKVIVGMWGTNVLDDENYTACSMWIEPKNVDYKCEPHWGHFEPYHEDVKLMQYTGLKDKNGKEIYEGDIVKTTGMIESIGKVVFKDCEFCIEVKDWYSTKPRYESLKLKEKYDDVKSSFKFDKHFEVIGNIYEDKDLLK